MKAVLQRVSKASVETSGHRVGAVGTGWLVLLGVAQGDSPSDLEYLVDKTVNLRAFPDENGKMNLSIKDVNGEILVISQFTLCADCRKGRRPSFTKAAPPELAEQYYENFVSAISSEGIRVETGTFQAYMQVELLNDGPVTFILDSKRQF